MKIVLAPGLDEGEKERTTAALKKIEDTQVDMYNYLDQLKYNPSINGGKYLSPEDVGYNDEASFDVIVEVGVANLDGVPRSEERNKNQSETSFNYSSSEEACGSASFGEGFDKFLSTDAGDGFFEIWDVTGIKVKITNIEQTKTVTPMFDLIRLKNNGSPHFKVKVDDYVAGQEGSWISHEFGHISGFLKNQLNTVWFSTGKRNTKKGHEDGNMSGEEATTKQKEYDEKNK